MFYSVAKFCIKIPKKLIHIFRSYTNSAGSRSRHFLGVYMTVAIYFQCNVCGLVFDSERNIYLLVTIYGMCENEFLMRSVIWYKNGYYLEHNEILFQDVLLLWVIWNFPQKVCRLRN